MKASIAFALASIDSRNSRARIFLKIGSFNATATNLVLIISRSGMKIIIGVLMRHDLCEETKAAMNHILSLSSSGLAVNCLRQILS